MILSRILLLFSFTMTIEKSYSFRPISLKMSLAGLQTELFDKVNAALKLKLTSYAADRNTWTEGSYSGACEWYEEKMGGKLTGVSKNAMKGPSGELYELSAWSGPAYSVPHMLLKISNSGSEISLHADYVVRGPNAFGSDQSVIENYYGNEVLDWYDSAAAKGKVLAPPASFSGRLLRSPLALSVGGLNEDDAVSIATAHVTRWLGWIADKEGKGKQIDARLRGGMNSRDDKLRQYMFRSNVADLTKTLGAVGGSLAAAWTGPIAEAYVGGGS